MVMFPIRRPHPRHNIRAINEPASLENPLINLFPPVHLCTPDKFLLNTLRNTRVDPVLIFNVIVYSVEDLAAAFLCSC